MKRFFQWIKRLFQWVKRLFAPADVPGSIQKWPSVPMPEAPTNCPACDGAIELEGDEYVCRGCPDEESAKANLSFGGVPRGFDGVPPCGWRGRADEFGVTWA